MKKTLFSIFAVAMVSAILVSCGNSETKETPESMDSTGMKTETAAMQYTCPMHPEVIANAPGQCPKCGMDLVKKESAQMPDSTMKADSSMKM